MTKERRLAIQMWEEILQRQPCNVSEYKASFCREHRLNWQHNCWFCHYVRQDHRWSLWSRMSIPMDYNGCQKCPIYEYNKCDWDDCGCTGAGGVFDQAAAPEYDITYRREATKIIIRLLKGEKLWDTGEEADK